MPEKSSFSRGEIPDDKRDTTRRKKESTDKSGKNLSEVRRRNTLFLPEKQSTGAQVTSDSTLGKRPHEESESVNLKEENKNWQKRITKENLQEAVQKAMEGDKAGIPYNETLLGFKQTSKEKAERAFHFGDTNFPPELDLKKWRANEGKFKDPDVRLSYQSTKDHPITLGGGIVAATKCEGEPLPGWPATKTTQLNGFLSTLRRTYSKHNFDFYKAITEVAKSDSTGFALYKEWHEHHGTSRKDYLGKSEQELKDEQRRIDEWRRNGGSGSMH